MRNSRKSRLRRSEATKLGSAAWEPGLKDTGIYPSIKMSEEKRQELLYQSGRMGDLVELMIRAQKNESWIEAICLSYTLLEIGLRRLLAYKNDPLVRRVCLDEIYKRQYMMELAQLALDAGYIDNIVFESIKRFNEVRRKAIHRFASGEIAYSALKGPAIRSLLLMLMLQDCWMPTGIDSEVARKRLKEQLLR